MTAGRTNHTRFASPPAAEGAAPISLQRDPRQHAWLLNLTEGELRFAYSMGKGFRAVADLLTPPVPGTPAKDLLSCEVIALCVACGIPVTVTTIDTFKVELLTLDAVRAEDDPAGGYVLHRSSTPASMSRLCPFRLGSDLCGYKGDAQYCAKTAEACVSLGNSHNFGGPLR